MICKYCGNVINDDATACPYCGTAVSDGTYAQSDNFSAPAYSDGAYDDGAYDNSTYDDGAYDNGAYADNTASYQDGGYYDDGGDDAEEEPAPKKKLNVKLPNINASMIVSIACAIFSFICLVMVSSLKADIGQNTKTIMNGLNGVSANVNAIEERINSLDTTVASVQENAYNQLASQTIDLTKDLMSLTQPVTLNKTAQMFIVKAKGSLNVNTSFVWQKYNEATGGWVDIVFTGSNSANEQYGLRLENKSPVDGEYESVLWANGITKAAEGTYRCVIKDTNGITKNSSEAIVSVTDTAA